MSALINDSTSLVADQIRQETQNLTEAQRDWLIHYAVSVIEGRSADAPNPSDFEFEDEVPSVGQDSRPCA